jgi:hypothetical protein
MSTSFWIHTVIFAVVFVVTGIVLSKKSRQNSGRMNRSSIEEVQAEIVDPSDLDIHQPDRWQDTDRRTGK